MTASFVARLLASAALAATTTAVAQNYELSTPDTAISVQPGESVDVPFVIVNHDSAASPELHLVMPSVVGNYAFEQRSAPACGPFTPSTVYADWTESTIAPIAAGATRTCTLRLTRNAGEFDNGFADAFIQESDSWLSLRIGTFVDFSISALKVASNRTPDGTIEAVYRIGANNASAIDTDGVTVVLGSACQPTRIQVDTGSGGCQPATNECGFGGTGPAARLPAIAAGAAASCLVTFTVPPGVDPSIAAGLVGASIHNAHTDGVMDDDNASNDIVELALQPLGALGAAAAPTLSSWAVILLALTLVVGAFAFRRKARGETATP